MIEWFWLEMTRNFHTEATKHTPDIVLSLELRYKTKMAQFRDRTGSFTLGVRSWKKAHEEKPWFWSGNHGVEIFQSLLNSFVDVVLITLLLTLNILYTFFYSFCRWLWTSKCYLGKLVTTQIYACVLLYFLLKVVTFDVST